jgi:hypothetical protein
MTCVPSGACAGVRQAGAERRRLDQERKDFGPDYHDQGWLFCWENGKPPHPDTIIGHSDVAFTMKQYVQTDLEADREVVNTLADLIIGGLLITGIEDQVDAPYRTDEASTEKCPCTNYMQEAGSLFGTGL